MHFVVIFAVFNCIFVVFFVVVYLFICLLIWSSREHASCSLRLRIVVCHVERRNGGRDRQRGCLGAVVLTRVGGRRVVGLFYDAKSEVVHVAILVNVLNVVVERRLPALVHCPQWLGAWRTISVLVVHTKSRIVPHGSNFKDVNIFERLGSQLVAQWVRFGSCSSSLLLIWRS